MVVESAAASERADPFLGHNRDRIAIIIGDMFFASVVAGDGDAATALAVCDRAVATVLRNPTPGRPFRPGEISAASALLKLVRRRTAMQARVVIERRVAARQAPVSAGVINAVDSVPHDPIYVDAEVVLDALTMFAKAISPKAAEMALAKRPPRALALAVVIYHHTRMGRRPAARLERPIVPDRQPPAS